MQMKHKNRTNSSKGRKLKKVAPTQAIIFDKTDLRQGRRKLHILDLNISVF